MLETGRINEGVSRNRAEGEKRRGCEVDEEGTEGRKEEGDGG